MYVFLCIYIYIYTTPASQFWTSSRSNNPNNLNNPINPERKDNSSLQTSRGIGEYDDDETNDFSDLPGFQSGIGELTGSENMFEEEDEILIYQKCIACESK